MMKRVSAILLSLALSASLCLPTLAAGITVDGKTVSDAEAVTMVPLRSVSEAWAGPSPGTAPFPVPGWRPVRSTSI